jgi:hypothetical protein
MPLGDYLEQTTLVTRVEVMSAAANAAGAAPALQRQVDRLRDVRDALTRFNQPASRGWSADLALAEWSLANAELELAIETGNIVARQAAADRRREWASVHYQRREQDADIGIAPLSALSQAEQLLVDSSGSAEERNVRAAGYRLRVDDAVAATTHWRDRDAGIGRADRVLQARVSARLARLIQVDHDGTASIDPGSLNAADADLRELFSTQLEFHQHGTAGVYDLARTWATWRELHQAAADTPDLIAREQSVEREHALRQLQAVAENTGDRRGRHAADVSFVGLLVRLNDIDAVRTTAGPIRRYLH